MSFDWDAMRREKEAFRRAATARPFSEKLQVVERLRERTVALRRKEPTAPLTDNARNAGGDGSMPAHRETE